MQTLWKENNQVQWNGEYRRWQKKRAGKEKIKRLENFTTLPLKYEHILSLSTSDKYKRCKNGELFYL